MFFESNTSYNTAFNSGQFAYNDASSSVQADMYNWNERRATHGMPLEHGYTSSAMRTHIHDSPSSEHNILPPAPIFNAPHIPRTMDYMPGSPGSSTDSSGDYETTASTQWNNSHHWTYAPSRDIRHHRHSRSNTTTPEFHPLNVHIPPPMPQLIDSAVTPYTPHDQFVHLNGYVFPHSLSPAHTPSPPPSYNNSLAIPTAIKSPALPSSGRLRETNGTKKCSHCQATTTPLWRRDPSTFKPLCNACGLYLQQRNRLRPQVLIDADADDGNTTDEADANYVGPECSHCRTHHTSVWRRSKTGAQLCNACGVYLRLRGKDRPLHLRKNKIKPRSKHPKD